MKKMAARLAEMLGYKIIPNWRSDRLPLATRLRQIFSDYQIEAVIDVGANEGQYRHFLRHEVGFQGVIESFEPLTELADRLVQQAMREDAKWRVHGNALGSEPGERFFNRMARSDFSSFRDPILGIGLPHEANNTVVAKMPVKVTTLDAEFADCQFDLRRTYLKLDTQGYDLEVVAGGHRVISQIPALQTEVSFYPLYKGIPDYRFAIATFEQSGFAVADFFLVSTDGTHRAVEFDCVMIRATGAGYTATRC